MRETDFRSGCPIATTLDVLGDKWTLVIVRDMLNGKAKFAEFLGSPEGVPTNILAARLKRMVETGLAKKTAYQERPKRFAYELTPKGRDLIPVVHAMCGWAKSHYSECWTPPVAFMDLRP